MSAAMLPVSVNCVLFEPVTITPPLLLAAKLPAAALIVSVTVWVSASASLKVMLLKSTALGTFCVMVTLAGRPVAVGSSLYP